MNLIKRCALCFLVLLMSACTNNHSELNKYFKDNKIYLQLDDSFVFKSKSSLPELIFAENSKGHDLIKISVKSIKDRAEAEEIIKKTIFLVVAQFQFTMAPYPGQITDATNCGNKFHPKLKTSDGTNYILAFSNERLALSICEGDDFTYKTAFAFYLNADNSQLFIVNYYQDKLSSDSRIANFLQENFKNYTNVKLANFQNMIK